MGTFEIGDIVEPKDVATKHMTKRLILDVTPYENYIIYKILCLVKGEINYIQMSFDDWIKVA